MNKLILLLLLFISAVGLSKLSAAESSSQFNQGADTLVVYKDVPGLPPSDKYTIRVRSAATNNEWVDVFTHYTYNRASELPRVPQSDGVDREITIQGYSKHTDGWSHSYGNIEMNSNQAVEVEIAAKNGFKIGGKDFFKATVHPAQKASAARVVGGKVYFTINKPAQIVIDINGQMDDYDAAVNGGIGAPVHTISLWANPVIKKPGMNNPRVRFIEPGTSLETINGISPSSYDTMYFKPGVHNIGRCLKLYPGKAIYIPGDAIIYGAMNNEDTPKPGRDISIFGYGTISGAKITHYKYIYYYPNESTISNPKPIVIEDAQNYRVHGVCVVDPPAHTVTLKGDGLITWAKTISWRQNGDGFGGWAEDCFVRTHDDCSYAKGNSKRCTYWKDAHAAFFHLASIPENRATPIIIEDCDILYARLRTQGDANIGGVFQQRGGGKAGQRNVNVLFRNIRIHDTRLGTTVFNLQSDKGSSYKGIVWQNISMPATTVKQRISGTAASPWYGGLTFDNVTIGGTLLTAGNFSTFFNSNEFVKDLMYKAPTNKTITATANGSGGTVYGTGSYNVGQPVTVAAYANENYKFVNWTENGVAVSTNLTYEFPAAQPRNLVANFTKYKKNK